VVTQCGHTTAWVNLYLFVTVATHLSGFMWSDLAVPAGGQSCSIIVWSLHLFRPSFISVSVSALVVLFVSICHHANEAGLCHMNKEVILVSNYLRNMVIYILNYSKLHL